MANGISFSSHEVTYNLTKSGHTYILKNRFNLISEMCAQIHLSSFLVGKRKDGRKDILFAVFWEDLTLILIVIYIFHPVLSDDHLQLLLITITINY